MKLTHQDLDASAGLLINSLFGKPSPEGDATADTREFCLSDLRGEVDAQKMLGAIREDILGKLESAHTARWVTLNRDHPFGGNTGFFRFTGLPKQQAEKHYDPSLDNPEWLTDEVRMAAALVETTMKMRGIKALKGLRLIQPGETV